MTNEVATIQDFETKVKDRIKKDIGELMPESVLQKMVEKCVEEMFFEREIHYGRTEKSWFEKEIKEVMLPIMKEQVSIYVEKNRKRIEEGIDNFLSEKNLILFFICFDAFFAIFSYNILL
jgi:hypothetical protein